MPQRLPELDQICFGEHFLAYNKIDVLDFGIVEEICHEPDSLAKLATICLTGPFWHGIRMRWLISTLGIIQLQIQPQKLSLEVNWE